MFYAGPYSRPPTNLGEVFVRTIYIWNALALFMRNSKGTYIKPTEGISDHAWDSISKMPAEGGYWIWIASSKVTDVDSEKNSYIFGAVYVTGVMTTKEYKRGYKSKVAMDQFKNSCGCEYQLIIAMHSYARLELAEPIIVHKVKGENRQAGVWQPNEETPIYEALSTARFVM